MAGSGLFNVLGWPLEGAHIYRYLEKMDLIGLEAFC